MALHDLIDKELIKVPLESGDKNSVLSELVTVLRDKGFISDGDSLLRALSEREAMGSTGLDKGIAVPHGQNRTGSGPLYCSGNLFRRSGF